MDRARAESDQTAAVLLRELHAGADTAWDRLYHLVGPSVRQLAVARLSDPEAAEDIVVETLAHAARGITRFDPQRASLLSWVLGIARRRVQLELRWQRRQKSVPAWAQVSFDDLPEPSGNEDLAERTAARLDARRRLEELPGLLSDEETEILTLAAIAELPMHEVARVVDRSPQATRVQLHRARQKARRSAIEGTLMVGACRYTQEGFHPYSHVFAGLEDRLVRDQFGVCCDLSPASDEIAYHLRGPGVHRYWPVSGHIWRAKRDGSGAMNLTEAAGLRGINVYPSWSPDGSMIAFVHWGEPGGWLVEPGEAWVVRADGSQARRVAPREVLPVAGCGWSPHGLCLLCGEEAAVAAAARGSAELWGRHVRLVPGVTAVAEPSSRDGNRVAWIRVERGRAEGEPGYWRQLVMAEADGIRPRVLVEQFITDAQLDAHCPGREELEAGPTYDWRYDALCWAGPASPRWSPRGDKIAFLAALPFDPAQMVHNRQVDAWVYDLVTRRLTKITGEPHFQRSLSWR